MKATRVSVWSAIAASSCCLPPLILLGLTFIGIGTAGVAGLSSTLGSLKWYIMPLAILGVGTSYYLYFREKKKCSTTACKMANGTFTKIMLTISTVVVFGFFSWSVYPYVLGSDSSIPVGGSSAHFAVYEVEGMTCGGCELAVDEAIAATGLVDSVKSSFIDGKAYVWYSADRIQLTGIEESIKRVGYEPRLLESN